VAFILRHIFAAVSLAFSTFIANYYSTSTRETSMARGMPSLAALLGLVAVAGYQNRDKIGDFIKGLSNQNAPDAAKQLPGAGADRSTITGGLGELIDRFRNSGQGDTADSWVNTGPNAQVTDDQLEKALGPDTIDNLAKQTGLSREELLSRLSKVLPEAVDKLTPDGRLPA
jgi:uncharacterized protein YidB (DUF937 family)